MKNYDVIAHAADVVGAKNDLESCILELENHRKNVNAIKTLLGHSWKGNTAKKIERRLSEVEKELVYRIDEFRKIGDDLDRYRRAMDSFANQFMMMGPKY
ncbi:hypothetical protein CON34_23790 [Bacillus thuringiensis]|uniref:hypothetical protein n=1 Tax=Bacillus thuringiensis TaxID=1428 RepID=UPI000BEDF32A|nr:hypothetical protein [Bacillus thuringiensis]MED4444708.1 hypothetical protein [Bacillus cereus]PEB44083.1 hypothetical protein COM82_30085 [Bacillus thuringiensis]PED23954.1 hypothetical protein CON34_23790 [Bacillus thuringiensis]